MNTTTTSSDPRREGRALKRIPFDQATIAARVAELGDEITRAYPDGELLVLGLLKGSFIFLSDLVRQINRPLKVDFLVASSYGNGTVSSGNVRLVYDPETVLEGKHILLVEDIVDSGRTLSRLMDLLKDRHPRSLDGAPDHVDPEGPISKPAGPYRRKQAQRSHASLRVPRVR